MNFGETGYNLMDQMGLRIRSMLMEMEGGFRSKVKVEVKVCVLVVKLSSQLTIKFQNKQALLTKPLLHKVMNLLNTLLPWNE